MTAPQISLSAGGLAALAAVAGVGLLGAWLWSKRGAIADAGAAAVDLVNPLSGGNLASRAANAVVQAVTGDPQQTLGGSIFDATPAGYRVDRALVLGPGAPPYISTSEIADPYGQQPIYAP